MLCPAQQKGDKKLGRWGEDSAGFYKEKMYKMGELKSRKTPKMYQAI